MFKVVCFLALSLAVFACPEDERCASCAVNSCLFCYDGFVQNGKCVESTLDIDHCLSYSSNGVCQQCQLDYQAVGGGCVKVEVDNCLITESNNLAKCRVCEDKILADANGVCNKDNRCEIKDCELCERTLQNTAKCYRCHKDFSL